MVSKLMVAGIAVLILGGFLFVLFSLLFPVIGISLYPFYVTTGSQDRREANLYINGNDDAEIALVTDVPRTPLPIMGVQVKASFYLRSDEDWECDVKLIHEDENHGQTEIPKTGKTIRGDADEQKLTTIYTSLNAEHSQGFILKVRIVNQEPSQIQLITSRVDISYTLFAQIFPIILTIVGLILTVVGFVTGRGPQVPKARAAPGGWEPTLQWGGGAAKQPKMAIKSTTAAPKKVKKVVKKAAPAGGAEQTCKFCGKPVPASAFFCPHCYGKLR
ncbi:MAG: hypothetical protein ACFFB5_19190 [Promethearchaeota archaeon]